MMETDSRYTVVPLTEASTTQSFLYRADGSASWTIGNASFIASVSGPMEVQKRDEIPDIAYIEMIVRPDVGVTSPREQFLEDRIRRTISPVILLEQHPRTLIQIVVQIVQSGDIKNINTLALSGGINATFMALLDAGIPLRSTISACSVIVVDGEDNDKKTILVNPEKRELEKYENKISSHHTIAYELKGGKIERLLLSESSGKFTNKILFDCYDIASEVCVNTNQTMRNTVAKAVEQWSKWKQ
ncbi:ribosomal protein S5 domain 2-type protein [Dipodascopsis uninucleata]